MKLTSWLRHSLAARVIISTSLLTTVAFSLAGSALNNRLSNGIKNVKLSSSVSDARSAYYSLQYEFLVAGNNPKAIRKAISDLSSDGSSFGASANSVPNLIFLPAPGTDITKIDYTTLTTFLNGAAIPKELRLRVAKSSSTQTSYANITNVFGNRAEVLIVGNRIKVPGTGNYEFYQIFGLEDLNKTLALISNSLFGFGVLLVLLVALVTFLVVRQVVKPVRDAAVTAESLASGNLDVRMNARGDDELARLAIAFNEMANSLQQQINRLENLSQVQQRFVGDVTHELRTPLTTLRMAASMIDSARDTFDPTIQRSVELMMIQLDRFERLLEDLLEISRFDAEVAVVDAVEFDITEKVAKVISDLKLVAKDADVHIEFDRPGDCVYVNADIRRIERALRNLITNAIDHAEGKPIHVTLRANENAASIGVRDFGIGLDQESASRVFDRFWRADPSRSRLRGGTGLGLSLALEDAHLHHGNIEVFGKLGAGANFVLTIPKKVTNQVPQSLIPVKF